MKTIVLATILLLLTPAVTALGAVDDASYSAARATGAADSDGDRILDKDDATPFGILDPIRSQVTLDSIQRISVMILNQASEVTFTVTAPSGDTTTIHIYDMIHACTSKYGSSLELIDGAISSRSISGAQYEIISGSLQGALADGTWSFTGQNVDRVNIIGSSYIPIQAGYYTNMATGRAELTETLNENSVFFQSIPDSQDSDGDGTPDIWDALPLNKNG